MKRDVGTNILHTNKSKFSIDFDNAPKQILGDGGLLSESIDEYELRTQQLDMCEDINKCISNGNIILAEGGTGLGKSFAYLVSGISDCIKRGRFLWLLQQTRKSLQNQLFEKDIPLISTLFNRED